MNVPNSLSLARICMIPLFVAAYFLPYEWGVYAAIAIFLLCCFTDFLDGYIARKYNMVTDLGKLLDPIADKILVCAALFCVVATNPLQNYSNAFDKIPQEYMADFGLIFLTVSSIVILARELLISAVRMIAASKGIVVQANIFGKVKTVLQDISLPLLILLNAQPYHFDAASGVNAGVNVFFDVVYYVAMLIFGVASFMTILSGVIYLVQNKKVFIAEQPAKSE